ncbi:MAG: S8 family serine peptidase [Cocleimonas sp.]|nr:S8 family serine peptidase [Cocleimonas sp.]
MKLHTVTTLIILLFLSACTTTRTIDTAAGPSRTETTTDYKPLVAALVIGGAIALYEYNKNKKPSHEAYTANDDAEEKTIKNQLVAIIPTGQSQQSLTQHPDINVIKSQTLINYPFNLLLLATNPQRSSQAVLNELQQKHPTFNIQANYQYSLLASDAPQYSLPLMQVNPQDKQAGQGIHIGMIDTLVDTSHSSLSSAKITQHLLLEQKASGKLHGTAIASLMVGQSGIKGIAPAAKLTSFAAFYASKKSKKSGNSTSFILARAFDKALSAHLDILNLSFGSSERDPLLERLVKGVAQRNISMVASAGNSKKATYYPAALQDVIAVTAIDARKRLYSHANRGQEIEFSAPGVNIISAKANGNYVLMSGTSFASAHISALLASKKSKGQSIVRHLLHRQAIALDQQAKSHLYGYGLLTVAQ